MVKGVPEDVKNLSDRVENGEEDGVVVDDEDHRDKEGQQPSHCETDDPSDDACLQRTLTTLLHAILELIVGALLGLFEQPTYTSTLALRVLVAHNINNNLQQRHQPISGDCLPI